MVGGEGNDELIEQMTMYGTFRKRKKNKNEPAGKYCEEHYGQCIRHSEKEEGDTVVPVLVEILVGLGIVAINSILVGLP